MNELQKNNDTNLDIWHNEKQLEEIKNVYAKGATATEFQTFVGVGRATGLNPFLREIWFVKYNQKDANIFIGRDGYRKTANRDKNYLRHHVEDVRLNDEFHYDANTGRIHHKYDFKNRGALFGAYCIVYMKNSEIPFYRFVELSEYDLKQSVWNGKKPTMIMKVAEAQCLKMACPELFGGTHDETEQPHIERSKLDADSMVNDMIESKNKTPLFDKLFDMINQAASLKDLDAIPILAKNLTQKNEIMDIRVMFKAKKEFIKQKDHDTETGEVHEAEILETRDLTEAEKISKKLGDAPDMEHLNIAADLIRSIPDLDEQQGLREIYEKRKLELK